MIVVHMSLLHVAISLVLRPSTVQICVYMLFKKEVLKYRSLNNNVYSFFQDASTVFDRVNHYVLFDKLLKRGVPLYVVRI